MKGIARHHEDWMEIYPRIKKSIAHILSVTISGYIYIIVLADNDEQMHTECLIIMIIVPFMQIQTIRRRATVTKQNILTLEGLTKLEEELNSLKNKRTEVADRIKQALAFGDISENAEYDEAKKEQAFVEGRIIQIENILRTAKVIDEEDIHTDIVSVGSKVLLKDVEFGDEVEYTIVGSAEADPMNLKISNESPVGKALVGKSAGDSVEIIVPDGIIKYEILQINK